jgi:hypothetical protein
MADQISCFFLTLTHYLLINLSTYSSTLLGSPTLFLTFMSLAFTDIAYEWDCTVFVFPWLLYFTSGDCFWLHSYCHKWQDIIFSRVNNISLYSIDAPVCSLISSQLYINNHSHWSEVIFSYGSDLYIPDEINDVQNSFLLSSFFVPFVFYYHVTVLLRVHCDI